MKLVSTKDSQKIFLTTNTKAVESTQNIDIILSPEFYWVRKFEIPVSSEKQAKELLPSLFEDIVDDISNLTFQAIKLQDNLFLSFAYNNQMIYEAIKKLNLSSTHINSFYFAQNECQNIEAFSIENQTYIYSEDNILIKIPNSIIEKATPLKTMIDDIKLSSHTLKIKFYNDIISSKFYYLLFTLFILLSLSNFLKYFNYIDETKQLEDKTENLKQINNLPSSMLQTDSILKKYTLILAQENKKREAISFIVSNKTYPLRSFSIDKKEIILEYAATDKTTIEEFLKKRFTIIKSELKTDTLNIRIKL